jgi:hypothetical protein
MPEAPTPISSSDPVHPLFPEECNNRPTPIHLDRYPVKMPTYPSEQFRPGQPAPAPRPQRPRPSLKGQPDIRSTKEYKLAARRYVFHSITFIKSAAFLPICPSLCVLDRIPPAIELLLCRTSH